MSLAASPPLVIVLTTLPSEDDAVALVRALLDRRLVACGTILPGARSVYRWEGAVEDAREAVVLLKTLEDQVEALRAAFADVHPYTVPELLVVPTVAAGRAYADWIAAGVRVE